MHPARWNLLFLAAGSASFAGLAVRAQPKSHFVERIEEGIFRHFELVALATPASQGDIANLGFVIGGDAVAVIDTGGSAAVGRAMPAAIRRAMAKR